jgi:hypothetical protein
VGLYVGSDNRLKEMVYHRGSPKSPVPALVTVAGDKKAGPLIFSTEHRGMADGKPLHLYFSKCGRQTSGVGHLDKRTLGSRRRRVSMANWSLWEVAFQRRSLKANSVSQKYLFVAGRVCADVSTSICIVPARRMGGRSLPYQT